MPLTITKTAQLDLADKEELILEAEADNSYPIGGYAFDASSLPYRVGVENLSAEGRSVSGAFYVSLDVTTGLLVWYDATTGLEVADTTDLTGEIARVRVLGR